MSAPRVHWLAYFWPGLPQLWLRGSWAGLVVAVVFTALGNVLLLATLVYGQWLTSQTKLIGGGVLAAIWLLARLLTRAERRSERLAAELTDDDPLSTDEATERPTAERDQRFREAQGHYLANDWVATEQVLLKLLKQDARDIESRLMLATLWRHQGRHTEALRQLDRVERLEAAEPWKNEIAAERMAINEAKETDTNETTEILTDSANEPITGEPITETEADNSPLDEQPRRAA